MGAAHDGSEEDAQTSRYIWKCAEIEKASWKKHFHFFLKIGAARDGGEEEEAQTARCISRENCVFFLKGNSWGGFLKIDNKLGGFLHKGKKLRLFSWKWAPPSMEVRRRPRPPVGGA